MRIADTVQDSIVDGPGFRFTVFTQGCPHGCKGCHNPATHDSAGGREITVDSLMALVKSNPLLDGVTLSGGEPFCQAAECADLAERVHAMGLNVWSYTGYTIEYLLKENDPDRMRLLHAVDVLVDGPFILSQRSLSFLWRGSLNQRLINVKETFKAGQLVFWEQLKYI